MKLASLKHGRDGRLVVVSQDLNWFTDAFLIAPTLQAALDDWQVVPLALHLVPPPGLRRPARVQRLIDYLAAGLERAPWATGAGAGR